jgi:hypothetical protein
MSADASSCSIQSLADFGMQSHLVADLCPHDVVSFSPVCDSDLSTLRHIQFFISDEFDHLKFENITSSITEAFIAAFGQPDSDMLQFYPEKHAHQVFLTHCHVPSTGCVIEQCLQ